MIKPFDFLLRWKSKILRNVFLIVVLLFIALGQLPVKLSVEKYAANPLVYVEIMILAIFYIGASYLNIYRLVPRLLLRNKYVSYISILLGFVVSIQLIEIVFEWMMIHVYHLPRGKYGLFAENSIVIVDFLSTFICYFISLSATSLIILLQHWGKSGERIHELEEAKVRVELEKVRNKIDSGALFEVLGKAASMVLSFPGEASRLLHELSKSLRRQLYESEYVKSFYARTDKFNKSFSEQNRLLDFLIEKRYGLVRNLLFILAACIVGGANVNPGHSFSWMEFIGFVVVFLVFFYFNIFILLPRFLLKNKLIEYLLSSVFLVIIFIVSYLPSGLKEEFKGVFWLFLISSIVQIGFVFAGTTAFVLFQHWARNERYIAKLEAATLNTELEQLQNQINPHFLFNMLNNILVLIQENPEEAVVVLHKLRDMLKYLYNDNTKKEVLLNDDIHFLTDFLNLEKIRRDRFEFTVSIENDAGKLLFPPLLFLPFVENAVKHGNDAVNPSYIRLYFGIKDDFLRFTCCNSKPVSPRKKNEYNGLGLINIQRRLELLYDNNHSLNFTEDEVTYTVQLTIKV